MSGAFTQQKYATFDAVEGNQKLLPGRDAVLVDDFFVNRPLAALAQMTSAGTTQANYEATINAAVQRAMAANKNFILTGTGIVAGGTAAAISTIEAECCVPAADFKGGIDIATRTTGTTAADTVNIHPGLGNGSVVITTLSTLRTVPEAQPFLDVVLQTPATITSYWLLVGFRILSTLPTTALDESTATELAAIGFHTASAVSGAKWRGVARSGNASILNAVLANKSGNALADVAASTRYRLRVEFDAQRQAHFYVGAGSAEPQWCGRTTPITAAAALVPFISLATLTGAARGVTVRRVKCGRLNT